MTELSPFQALQHEDFFMAFMIQLLKDFEGAGAALEERAIIPRELSELTQFLAAQIKRVDRNGLLNGLLYRIDLSEAQIKIAASKQPDLSYEEILADLIIRRTLQKVILRKKFTS